MLNLKCESGIINLDDSTSDGTHWVAYNKNRKSIHYFDSFGNLQPPKEVVKYLGKNINYNYVREQKHFNTNNCGHLQPWEFLVPTLNLYLNLNLNFKFIKYNVFYF